jgi:DNA sulfur modification protein DndB
MPQVFRGTIDPGAEVGIANDTKRVRELVRHILDNPAQYSLPPLIACIDGKVEFDRSTDGDVNVGIVRIGMDARVMLSDGGHSIAVIAAVLATNPKLADDTVSVVLIPDSGLKRSRQIFADLARNSVRNSTSLTLLYDQKSEAARLAKGVMRAVPFFAELTETKKSSISNRSTKLFTLSAIHSATQALFAGVDVGVLKEKIKVAAAFWSEVGRYIPDWRLAMDHEIATADLRRDFVHAHALALAAIARVGNQLLAHFRRNWKARLKKLSTLDWSRANSAQWEGRAMNAGRLSKRSVNVILTGNLIKRHLGLDLSPEEEAMEREFHGIQSGRVATRELRR